MIYRARWPFWLMFALCALFLGLKGLTVARNTSQLAKGCH